MLDLLERYENTSFKNFKKALYYKDWEKEKILNIKFSEFSLEEFKTISMEKLNKVLTLEKYYKNHKENYNLKEKLDNIIKNIVKTSLYLELH
ncbi:hypothetical protein ACTQ4P_11745 [Clostridium sporogenes]|uniref:hypothetical protein n=1 Tax=Clostridium sporogenes TaxID=1509 RepID=UPI003F92313E